MATYYVRADGTVLAANKASATGDAPSTALSYAQYVAASFADNDVIIFSPNGGVFTDYLRPVRNNLVLKGLNYLPSRLPGSYEMPVFAPVSVGYGASIFANNTQILGFHITAQRGTYVGVRGAGNVSGNVVSGCLIDDCFRAVDINANTTYRANVIKNIKNTAFVCTEGLPSGKTATIDCNIIINCGSHAIQPAGLAGSLYVTRNNVAGYSGHGVLIANSTTCENLVINDNIIAGGRGGGYGISIGTGITVSGSKSVSKNHITGSGDHPSGVVATQYINFGTAGFDGGDNIVNGTKSGIKSYPWKFGTISFDDAGNKDGQFPQIVAMLDYMKSKNAFGTWFVDFANVGDYGNFADHWSEIARCATDGHEIGCHSLSHLQFHDTIMAKQLNFVRVGGTNPRVVIAYSDNDTGTIEFLTDAGSDGVIPFNSPSDAELLSRAETVHNIVYLKANVPAGWSVAGDAFTPNVSGCNETLLLVELAAGTYNSGAWVPAREGGYSAGLPTRAHGVYYWEIVKAKEILEAKLQSLGVDGYVSKTFAYPAWTYTVKAVAALKAAGFVSARAAADGVPAPSYVLSAAYSMFNAGLQFQVADIWVSTAVSLPRLRGYIAQAMTRMAICSTMMHGYSQFGAGSTTIAPFSTMLDEMVSAGLNITTIGAIHDYMVSSGLWVTADSGLTYTLDVGKFPPSVEDMTFVPSSPCIGAGGDLGYTTDFLSNAVPGAVGYDIGPYSYMPGWTTFDGTLPALALSPTAPGKLLEVQEWSKPVTKKQIDGVR